MYFALQWRRPGVCENDERLLGGPLFLESAVEELPSREKEVATEESGGEEKDAEIHKELDPAEPFAAEGHALRGK